MKNIFLTILCVMFIAAFAGCDDGDDNGDAEPTPTPTPAPTLSNEEKAAAVLESLESGDVSVIGEYISADTYIQHNLGFPDGRQAVIDAIDAGMLSGTTVEVVRSFTDGDYVILHSDYFLFGARQVGFDVFRFEDGLIVEHWDNLQDYAGPNPSGRTMLDGPTDETDLYKTGENKALVQSFLNDMGSGNFGAMASYFDGDSYIQHNPNVGDGLSALMSGGAGDMYYLRTHYVHGSGDFVLAMSEGRMNGEPTAFYDMFRVENGFIAEHWDVIQEIPAESERANTNGKFGNDVGLLNEEKAVAVLKSLESGDTWAIENYISADTYIQHNPGFPDGRQAVLDAMNAGMLDGTTVEVIRSFTDGDYVVTHSDYFLFGAQQVGFDVFRFENGLIVEHWDNLQAADGNAVSDANGNTMLDGPTEITDQQLTADNKALVSDFAQNLFVNGQWSSYTDYFDEGVYTQHNPEFPNGTGLFTMFPDGTPFFQSVEYVHGEGNFVLTMSRGYPDQETGLASAYYDLFRVENGKIVEHWDVVQEIPPESEWVNSNGKFGGDSECQNCS